MVYFMENPMKMDDDVWGTPIYRPPMGRSWGCSGINPLRIGVCGIGWGDDRDMGVSINGVTQK